MSDQPKDLSFTDPGNSEDPKPDFTASELAQYILKEFYVEPAQPGDMTTRQVAELLGISPEHVRKRLLPAIVSGKIKFIKRARDESGRALSVYRMAKV